MCTYITAVVSAGADEAALRQIADRWGHGWEAIDNPHVQAQLKTGERYFLTTRKRCDCGTALGSAGPEWRHRRKDPTDRVPELRRKGWSEAKIARWLEDKQRAAGHHERKEAWLAGQPPGPEEEMWLGFLREALGGGAARGIGLLLHWYSGGVDSERISVKARSAVPLAVGSEDLLRRMEYGHLYMFTNQ